MADYKHTINLPTTDFPMKADLARREPEMLKWWDEQDIYGKLRDRQRSADFYHARRSTVCEWPDSLRACN